VREGATLPCPARKGAMKLQDRGSAISLGMKRMEACNAGNPHVACDAEGDGNSKGPAHSLGK
jgi:hypothetical protein